MSYDDPLVRIAAPLLFWHALSACSAPPPVELALARAPLIYGSDDRRDIYAVEDVEVRRVALSGTAALMPSRSIQSTATGALVFGTQTLTDVFDLCDSEPFVGQPSLAICSGVLLDPDLVVTAAHCVTFSPCEDQRWVFGYAISKEGAGPELDENAVYRCRSIPVREYGTAPDGRRMDFAVVQLDRPVSADRRAPPIATHGIPLGERATVIGYPSGLPVKVDRGATVLDTREAEDDYLSMASDTFMGSSGSGVFNRQNELVAIVVRGGVDYEYRPELGCYVSRRIPEGQETERGEHASYVTSAINALCGSGWASEGRCQRRSVCGDGQCSIDEHEGPCGGDCPSIDSRVRGFPQGGGCTFAPSGPAAGGWALLLGAAVSRAWRRNRGLKDAGEKTIPPRTR